jgi:hypothetical protein
MLFLSSLFGGVSSFIGLIIAYMYNLPSGATIVLTVILIFLVSFIASPKRRASPFTSQHDQHRHVEECKYCVIDDVAKECAYCADEEQELGVKVGSPHEHHEELEHEHDDFDKDASEVIPFQQED